MSIAIGPAVGPISQNSNGFFELTEHRDQPNFLHKNTVRYNAKKIHSPDGEDYGEE